MVEQEEVYVCIECGEEVEPMDIPLCSFCAKKYDLERFWKDHDTENPDGWYEPHQFIENPQVRAKYCKCFEYGDLCKNGQCSKGKRTCCYFCDVKKCEHFCDFLYVEE